MGVVGFDPGGEDAVGCFESIGGVFRGEKGVLIGVWGSLCLGGFGGLGATAGL